MKTEEEVRDRLKKIANHRRAAKSQGRDESYICCRKMEKLLKWILEDGIKI